MKPWICKFARSLLEISLQSGVMSTTSIEVVWDFMALVFHCNTAYTKCFGRKFITSAIVRVPDCAQENSDIADLFLWIRMGTAHASSANVDSSIECYILSCFGILLWCTANLSLPIWPILSEFIALFCAPQVRVNLLAVHFLLRTCLSFSRAHLWCKRQVHP